MRSKWSNHIMKWNTIVIQSWSCSWSLRFFFFCNVAVSNLPSTYISRTGSIEAESLGFRSPSQWHKAWSRMCVRNDPSNVGHNRHLRMLPLSWHRFTADFCHCIRARTFSEMYIISCNSLCMGEMTCHSGILPRSETLGAEITYQNSGGPSHLLKMTSGHASTLWWTKERMFYLKTGRYRSVSQILTSASVPDKIQLINIGCVPKVIGCRPLLVRTICDNTKLGSCSLDPLYNLTACNPTPNPNGEPQPTSTSTSHTMRLSLEIAVVEYCRYL